MSIDEQNIDDQIMDIIVDGNPGWECISEKEESSNDHFEITVTPEDSTKINEVDEFIIKEYITVQKFRRFQRKQ